MKDSGDGVDPFTFSGSVRPSQKGNKSKPQIQDNVGPFWNDVKYGNANESAFEGC